MYGISVLLVLAGATSAVIAKEIYERSVDDIFEKAIGNIHESRKKLAARGRTYKSYYITLPPLNSTKKPTSSRKKASDSQWTTTTEKIRIATPNPKMNENVSMALFKFRMKQMYINKLVNEKNTKLPSFDEEECNPDIITRRFDALVVQNQKSKPKPILRQIYEDYDDVEFIKHQKTRIIGIMQSYIYSTRYRLVYMQLMRKKYWRQIRYQIGFCFALIRNLKQQQMNLYTAMAKTHQYMNQGIIAVKIYEKIVKLYVDIRDVEKLIFRLDYRKKIFENPNYYVDSVEAPTIIKPKLGPPSSSDEDAGKKKV